MKREYFSPGPIVVTSPCIGICTITNDLCAGCARTLDEIVDWSKMTEARRQAIMRRVAKTRGIDRQAS